MYIFLDTECGGLTADCSLLELGLVITDNNFNIVDEKLFPLKPDDGIYRVTAGGLAVNQINLVEHNKYAISYKVAKTALYNTLNSWWEQFDHELLVPVGKNLTYDLTAIYTYLLAKASWDKFVSYQPIEISTVVRVAQLMNKLPPLEKTSLISIAQHFNIPVRDEHTSIGDCYLGVYVMRKLKELLV